MSGSGCGTPGGPLPFPTAEREDKLPAVDLPSATGAELRDGQAAAFPGTGGKGAVKTRTQRTVSSRVRAMLSHSALGTTERLFKAVEFMGHNKLSPQGEGET